MELDFERCYRAVASRDPRFDGWFFTAVTSTGIYCRPSCPAITPRPENVRFFRSVAACQRSGFRACRRCRPDAVPGSPEWDTRADVVGRAMRLIADGVVDRDGVPGLARRLGYTPRHLHRMLAAELGAGPLALARAQRAQTARVLVETTDLGFAEIAFAAGFGSVRQFNDTMREVYAVAPSELRAAARREPGGTPGAVTLRLAYRAPLHAPALLTFLAERAVPSVEWVDESCYRRVLRLPHGQADATLIPREGYISAVLRLTDLRDLAPAVARCRRLFDLDADPEAVDAALADDPALAPLVAKEPGVRVPRAVDGFEIALRAIIGQQISVRGARTLLDRLATACAAVRAGAAAPAPTAPTAHAATAARTGRAAHGTPDGTHLRLFPSPAELLELPDEAFPMPAARRHTIRALAEAVLRGDVALDGAADRTETAARLRELPGIGEWTSGYVAMRALGDPDVLLPTDLGVRRGAAALGLPDDPKALARYAERWRPWRSYALIRLWRSS